MKQAPLLHTEVHGSGPTVVLLHGFLASSKYWQKVTELAASNHRVITIDLLGFGKSPKPRNSRYDYDAHLASLSRTIRHQNIKEPFTLVGHSMGALLALRLANLYPESIRKLVLTNMPIMMNKREVKTEIINSNIAYRLGLSPITHHIMWKSVKSLYALKLLPLHALQRLSINSEYVFSHTAKSRLQSFRRVIMQAKVDLDLAGVKVKTVILSGIDDRKVYIENLMAKISVGPNVSIQNLKVDHHIPLKMPEQVVSVL